MTLAALAWIAASACPLAALADEPPFEKTVLFTAGHEGYYTYRIPAICVTPEGTVIAAVAGRYDSASDWANVDLVIRRSPDGGATWDDQQVLVDDGANTVDNPTFIVDLKSGAVHLMYQIQYARAYVKTSLDEGVTWSPPREITYVFDEFRTRDGYDWEVLAMGPGHGITLRNGRMVVPVWLSTDHRHRPSISATICSDNAGETWQAGDVIVATTEETPNPSEHQLVELADGRVLANIRTESPRHRRVIATSPNGATDWTDPKFAGDLYEPICMGSTVRVANAKDGRGRAENSPAVLLFSNPDSGPAQPGGKQGSRDRRNLTIKLSTDGGATWSLARTIDVGPSGYSDMAVSTTGDVYLMYEAQQKNPEGPFVPGTITLIKLDAGRLTAE
ncbi:MAG TPA: sialidase family protein [Lacipirellula sp.]